MFNKHRCFCCLLEKLQENVELWTLPTSTELTLHEPLFQSYLYLIFTKFTGLNWLSIMYQHLSPSLFRLLHATFWAGDAAAGMIQNITTSPTFAIHNTQYCIKLRSCDRIANPCLAGLLVILLCPLINLGSTRQAPFRPLPSCATKYSPWLLLKRLASLASRVVTWQFVQYFAVSIHLFTALLLRRI